MKRLNSIILLSILMLIGLLIMEREMIVEPKNEEDLEEWVTYYDTFTFLLTPEIGDIQNCVIAYGVYDKPQITYRTHYAAYFYNYSVEGQSNNLTSVNTFNLLEPQRLKQEELNLTFLEMYNKAKGEKMLMIIKRCYVRGKEKIGLIPMFLSKDGYLYVFFENRRYGEKENGREWVYYKHVDKYLITDGASVYKEIKKLAQ